MALSRRPRDLFRPLRHLAVGAALALTASLAIGCASAPADRSTSVPEQRLDLDPMLVRVGPDGETTTLEAEEVFKKAYEAYSARRYERAARHYEAVIEYFEDSKYYLPSLYNLGLTYEKLELWDKSAQAYRRIIEEFPDDEGTSDAFYRLAEAHKELEEHERVVELMTNVLLKDDLNHFDRIEAHLRRADAQLGLGQWEQASDGFRMLLELNDRAEVDQQLPPDNHLILQAHFGLGRSYHERVRQIPLVLPTERMGDDLERKAELFGAAQRHYIHTLRHHHPHWSMAAGYMIGRLYEDFYADIFAAEIPDDLGEEGVALYFDELRTHITPLMERAIQVYEKNLSLSQRMGQSEEKNRWVAETAQSLERVRSFLNDPITQRRAQRLVVEGRKMERLWDPQGTAVDLVDIAVEDAREAALGPAEPKDGPES